MAQGNCQACNHFGMLDRAHIKSKGSGGTWDEDNLLMLCRSCPGFQHRHGWVRFIKKHSHLTQILDQKGFAIVNVFGINRLQRK